MNICLKYNGVVLWSNLDPSDFEKLVHLHSIGEVHISISVHQGERAGFIPLEDIDIALTREALKTSDDQLVINW